MRQRSKPLAVWVGVLVLLLAVWGGARNVLLSSQLADLKLKEREVCNRILGGKKELAGKECVSEIKNTVKNPGIQKVPNWSATDVYLKLAQSLPNNATNKIKITNFIVEDLDVRFSADTPSFVTADEIVKNLKAGNCLNDVEKTQSRQVPNGVRFDVKLKFDCNKKIETAELSQLQAPKEN